MEYCDGGSALDILNATKSTFKEDQISAICAQVNTIYIIFFSKKNIYIYIRWLKVYHIFILIKFYIVILK